MRIEHLYYLQEIARTASFSAAANNLFISQQSLSDFVSKVEKEYGLKIFRRSRSGTFLTEKGQEFLKDVEELLSKYESLSAKYHPNTDANADGTLSLAIDHHISTLYLESLYRQYTQKYPQNTLYITEEFDVKNIFQKVMNHQIDIGLTGIYWHTYKNAPWLKQDALQKFTFEELYLDYICALVSKEHPLSAHQSIAIDDLKTEKLIVDNFDILQGSVAKTV